MHHLIVKIDRDIDEVLVSLGNMVLRLSCPALMRTAEQHQALARSVNQFSLCANRSTDPRVQKLSEQLKDSLRPRLRLVASRSGVSDHSRLREGVRGWGSQTR